MALNEVGNPYKCPCCFPCDTIPLCTADFPDCPSSYYCGPTRRENDPGWATPTYTPKCKRGWGASGADCVYWSPEVGNALCNCTGVWAQYCIDYPSGYKGRAWVVEFFCIDGATQVVSAATYIASNWQCACSDIPGQLAGPGPRFQFFITPSGCCCSCAGAPDCSCDPPSTLYADIGYGSGAETATLVESAPNWGGGALLGCIGNLTLYCSGGEWKLDIVDQLGICPTETITATGGTCTPFSLDFTFTPPGCFGCADGTLPITITE